MSDEKIKSKTRIELLSPAKNLEHGIAAIDYGADAVYIGAPKFSARKAAGNSLSDISALIEYAHKYWANIYIALNTILFDNELDEALSIIRSVYSAGADALIIQDMGLLEMDLPPIPLIASTQAHNYDIGKIQFLEQVGFQRVILSRELSLQQIRNIRANTNIELECFIHGALCVCFSGQCYLSAAIKGRSANRGECAQPCRLRYSLKDEDGHSIAKDKYLLSLKDLNLSQELPDLIHAGITSFKIEGRLKDIKYVKNVTAYYRKKIDEFLINESTFSSASSGTTHIPFSPDPAKTFNRGFTSYFIHQRSRDILSPETPKSIGALMGKVIKVTRDSFYLDGKLKVHPGDGICFFNSANVLNGTDVYKIEMNRIYPSEMKGIHEGILMYRNYDHVFAKFLKANHFKRSVKTRMFFSEMKDGFCLKANDEDGNEAEATLEMKKKKAQKPNLAEATLRQQLMKSGETIFDVESVIIDLHEHYFLQMRLINSLRRDVLEKLEGKRSKNRPRLLKKFEKTMVPFYSSKPDHNLNVSNEKARQFYERHGLYIIDQAFEQQHNHLGQTVMTMKHCLRNQFGLCPENTNIKLKFLILSDKNHSFRLDCNCERCEMKLVLVEADSH